MKRAHTKADAVHRFGGFHGAALDATWGSTPSRNW
jgi:hypothetical protein